MLLLSVALLTKQDGMRRAGIIGLGVGAGVGVGGEAAVVVENSD